MKKHFSFGFTALLAVIFALAASGCDSSGDGGDSTPGSGAYNSVEDLAGLSGIPTGEAYTAILGGGIDISGRWADISAAVLAAQKYVILDLSACSVPGNAISGSVTPVGNDFNIIRNNPYVTGLILPKNLQYLDEAALWNCHGLGSVILPEGLLSIGNYAFSGCSSLRPLTLPESLTSIGNYAFEQNILSAISIPDSVNFIGDYAFQNCTNLAAVKLPSGGSLSFGTYVFSGCTSLTSITVAAGVTSLSTRAFQNCTNLTSVTLSASVAGTICEGAFRGTGLTSIRIPAGVTIIRPYVFAECASFTTVIFDAAGITLT